MSLSNRFLTIAVFLLAIFSYSSAMAQKTCWDSFEWGTKETSFVKPQWAKTIIPKSMTVYVEVEEIKGGQIRRRYTFVDGELAEFMMSVYSISLPQERLRYFVWNPCYEKLGQPVEELSDLIYWDGQKVESMVTGGIKDGMYWISATHNKHLSLILTSVAYIPKIF